MSNRICKCLFPVILPISLAFHQNGGDPDQIRKLREGTIRSLTQRLETQHYAPRAINDAYAVDVWTKFLSDLDREKIIFLAKDITFLEKYKTSIDDEMHAHSVEFFDSVMSIYRQRVGEVMTLYSNLLNKPVALHSHRSIVENGIGKTWPDNEKRREELWQDRVRLYVLKKLSDQGGNQPVQGQSAGGQPAPERKTPDAASNAAARASVRKWLDYSYRFMTSPEGEDQRFSMYMNEMMGCMDPHSTFFAPVDARSMTEQMARKYYGLGMELNASEGEIVVKSLMPGGNAFKSGLLKVNDKIIAVSGEDKQMIDVAGLPVTEVSKLIRGDKGTTVRLQVSRSGGLSQVIELERGELKQEESAARATVLREGGCRIGYIYLPLFYADTENPLGAHCSDDVSKLVLQLKTAGVDAMIIDLRDNPGGSLDEVVKMAGQFVKEGPIVQLREKDSSVSVMTKPSDSEPLYTGPMAVLVNSGSASASEIFAAAMQDYKRAIIIGARTFGKGTAQSQLPMGKVADKLHDQPAINFGAIRLSIKKFYRINGGSTQLRGVTPDLLLPDGLGYYPNRETDMPFALAWDEIPAYPYTPLKPFWDQEMLSRLTADASKDSAFTLIQSNTQWLKDNLNAPLVLDLDQIRSRTASVNAHVTGIGTAQQMAPAGLVTTVGAFTPDSTGKDLQWTNSLQKDIYIHEAIIVLQQAIPAEGKK